MGERKKCTAGRHPARPEVVKRAIVDSLLTVEKLAEAAEVSRDVILAMSNVKKPGCHTLDSYQRVAKALGKKPSEFFHFNDSPLPNNLGNLVFSVRLEGPEENKDLLLAGLDLYKALAARLNYSVVAKLESVTHGSVVLWIEGSLDDFERTRKALVDGELSDLGVTAVSVSTAPAKTASPSGRWLPSVCYALHAASLLCALSGLAPIDARPWLWVGVVSAIGAFALNRKSSGRIRLRLWMSVVLLLLNGTQLYSWPNGFGLWRDFDGSLRFGRHHKWHNLEIQHIDTPTVVFVAEPRDTNGGLTWELDGKPLPSVPTRIRSNILVYGSEDNREERLISPGMHRLIVRWNDGDIFNDDIYLNPTTQVRSLYQISSDEYHYRLNTVYEKPELAASFSGRTAGIWLDFDVEPTDAEFSHFILIKRLTPEDMAARPASRVAELTGKEPTSSPIRYSRARTDLPDFAVRPGESGISIVCQGKILFTGRVDLKPTWDKNNGALVIPIRNWKN